MTTERLAALRTAMADADFDCLAIVPGPNLMYLTGLSFHLSERPTVVLLPASGDPVAVVPTLEAAKAESSPLGFQVFHYGDSAGPSQAFADACAAVALDQRRLGVEGRRIRFLELQLLGGAPHVASADAVFAVLRMQKDGDEIAQMQKAVAIAETAFEKTLPYLKAGAVEAEIASELVAQLLRNGSEPELPFSPIVATGANGALPHAVPGDAKMAAGDLVVIDWGASAGGYFSDITRTIAIAGAAVPERLQAAYEAVRAANEAGRNTVRPGATGQDIDRATRRVITEAGFGDYFTHRTGHGLGLECHEEPDMSEVSLTPLQEGMTFTIEPGVYLPGLGGIRIEDDIVVTASGGESLTNLPREITSVG
ncbi:MAG: aminopeptidase P family protein [Planctomycetota bacterium]